MSIYIITHKYLKEKVCKLGYKYLYVGAYRQQDRREGYLYDDVGANISEKNSTYCELTGLYWIWKNCSDSYKGLMHYRRFFTANSLSINKRFFFDESQLQVKLKNCDILVGERIYLSENSVYNDYAAYHYKKDIDNLIDLIHKQFSDYSNALDIVLERNYYCPANMFYCRADVLDKYCTWLFEVLTEFEKITDISQYNAQQSRIYGFIAERLLNVWIEKNKLSKKEIRIVQTDSRFRLRIRKKLDLIFKRSMTKKQKYEK